MLHLPNVVNPVQHPSGYQPLNGFLKIPGTSALTYSAIDKLFIRLCQLGHNAAEHHQNASAVDLPVVLRKVVFIYLNEFTLDLPNLCRILVLHPGRNTFRHSADDEIIIKSIQQPIVEDFLYVLFFLNAFIIGVKNGVGCVQEFIKGQRVNVQKIDHSNRIGFRCCQKCSQQASCRNHMVIVCLLFEVFQGIQSRGAFLNFVKNDECLLRQNFLTGNQRQQFDDSLWILVGFENGFQFLFFVKVEVYKAVIGRSSKLFHQPGFPDLSGSF